jgi:hypothetical protein
MEKEIKFKFTSDPSKLNKDLDDAQKKAEGTEKSAQRAGTSIGDAVRTLAGAIAGAKIIGFFREAVAESAKLEQALAKVTATARAFKQSTSQAKQAAVELAQDGFLTVTQSAQTLSNLMAVGLNLDQAKKFIVASKEVTSFGNTIGDAGQAVADLSLGLLRGSALVIDNASPALKSLANKYQSLVDTQGKAKAAQYAFNEVTKVASKYTGDAARYMDTLTGATARFNAVTDKAKASIGDALAPALKSLYSAMSDVVEGFTKWFSALRGPQQTIGILTVGLVALVPVIYAVNGALALLAVNPVVLTIMAIVAAIGAVVLAAEALYNSLKPGRGENLMDQKKAQEDEIKLLALNKKHSVELANAKERLKKINEEITESYGDLLKQYKLENAAYETKLNFIRRIDEAERNLGGNARIRGLSNSELEAEMAELIAANARARRAPSSVLSSAQREYMMGNTTAEINILRREKARRAAHPETPGTVAHDAPVVVNKYKDTRFLEIANKLKEIEAERSYTENLARNTAGLSVRERKRRIDNANDDARVMSENEINTLREAYAQWTEDKFMADTAAIEKGRRAARKQSGELWEAERTQKDIQLADDIRKARGNATEIADLRTKHANDLGKLEDDWKTRNAAIEHAAAMKTIKIYSEGFNGLLEKSTAIAKAIKKIRSGDISGAGDIITSGAGLGAGFMDQLARGGVVDAKGETFGKLQKVFGVAGSVVGPMVSGLTGLGSAIGDLFGKSDEEMRREAAEQKRRDEEAKALLELQANYQKSMLALQEAQAKLPFEELSRKLRLADISAQKALIGGADPVATETKRLADRLELMQNTLSTEGGAISGGALFNNVGATPDELIDFLNKTAALKTELGPLFNLAQQQRAGVDPFTTGLAIIRQTQAEMQRLGYDPYETRIASARFAGYQEWEKNNIRALIAQGNAAPLGISQAAIDYVPQLTAKDKLVAAAFTQSLSGQYGNTQLDTMLSEMGIDTGIAENLLSVIEQSQQTQLEIAGHTKATAQNTALQLETDRNAAFIDIAGGGLRQFGGFLSGMPLTLSDQAAALSVSSVAASAAQKNDIELLAEILVVNKDMRKLLTDIAINTEGLSGTSEGLGKAELLQMLADFKAAA